MKKIGLFLFNGMTDFEITFVAHLLKTEGEYQVVTFSYDEETIVGKTGLTYKCDKLIKDISSDDIEGLIIPGGYYGDFRESLMDLIRRLNNEKKLLAGICGAGTVALAKSGVLNNRLYTTPATPWTEQHKEAFKMDDPFNRSNFLLTRTVKDENIITAQGVAFIDFSLEICHILGMFKSDQEKLTFGKTIKGI